MKKASLLPPITLKLPSESEKALVNGSGPKIMTSMLLEKNQNSITLEGRASDNSV
jgi:hypothetical protein